MGWIVFLYPLMELWSLIELGAQTTAGTAVLWVLAAGLVGLGAIRFAGTQVLTRLQAAQREGALQQHLLAGDMALAFAGLLLMVPGLISDANIPRVLETINALSRINSISSRVLSIIPDILEIGVCVFVGFLF